MNEELEVKIQGLENRIDELEHQNRELSEELLSVQEQNDTLTEAIRGAQIALNVL